MTIMNTQASFSDGQLLRNEVDLTLWARVLNKYWNFAFIAGVLFFHFALNAMGATTSNILLWVATHFSYLLILLTARNRYTYYDARSLRFLRILINIFFISWLIAISPESGTILWVFYAVPIMVGVATFENVLANAVILLISIIGVFLATQGYTTESILSQQQFWSIVVVLFVYWFALYLLARKIFVSRKDEQVGSVSRISRDREQIVNKALKIGKELSQADRTLLIVIHPEKGHYITHASSGFDLKDGKSIDALAKECRIIDGRDSFQTLNAWAEFKKGTIYSKYFTCNPQSILAEPLFTLDGQAVVGVLTLAHDRANAFDRLARNAVRNFALRLGPEIEDYINLHQLRLRKARNVELGGLFARTENQDEVIKILVDEVLEQLDSVSGIVYHKYDQSANLLVPANVSYTSIDELTNSPMKPGIGIAGQVFKLKEPLRITNVQEHPWFEESRQRIDFKSLLTIPVYEPEHEAVYGTLSLHRSENSASFSSEDEERGVRLCTEAAIALRKITELEEARTHAVRLQRILNSVPKLELTNQEEDQQRLYDQIVSRASRILGFRAVTFHKLDQLTDEDVFSAAIGIPQEEVRERLGNRTPCTQWMSVEKDEFRIGHRTYFIPGQRPEHKSLSTNDFIYLDGYDERWDKDNFLFTRLESNGQYLGSLSYDLPEDGQLLSPELINAMDVFGAMSVWILERNASNMKRMAIMRSITTSLPASKDWDAVGKFVVDAGVKLIDAEACSLYLAHENEIELTHSNYQAAKIGCKKPLVLRSGCGLAAWIVLTGKSVCSNDGHYKNHPAWSGNIDHLDLLESGSCRNLLAVPIKSALDDSTNIGVLSFENKTGFSSGFDKTDEKLAQEMAHHIAVVKRQIDYNILLEKLEQWGLQDDLHELVNWQQLGVVTPLESVIRFLEKDRVDSAHDLLPDILHNARSAATEIDRLHAIVHSEYLEIEDCRTALETLRDEWAKRIDPQNRLAPIEVKCPAQTQLNPAVRIALLKIASNALINAIEHSGALKDNKIRIEVSLTENDNGFQLSVVDNGYGRDELRKGYGLTRMEQIVTQITENSKIPYELKLILESSRKYGTKVFVQATQIEM